MWPSHEDKMKQPYYKTRHSQSFDDNLVPNNFIAKESFASSNVKRQRTPMVSYNENMPSTISPPPGWPAYENQSIESANPQLSIDNALS